MTTDSPGLSEPLLSGRDSELARLAGFLEESSKGRGRTVFVVGEAGIGKTRLANEILHRAKALRFKVLTGQCLPGSPEPYLPFEEALRDLFKIHKDESDTTAKRKISGTIKREIPEAAESIQTVELLLRTSTVTTPQESQLGIWGWLKGPKQASYQDYVDLKRKGSLKERFLEAFSSLIVDIARREPVLLFLDDLQWADPSSLTLLHLLARRTKASRVLVIGAYRSEELRAKTGPTSLSETLQAMSREGLFVKVELGPLTKHSYSEILGSIFQTDFGNEFVGRLYRDTEGNPFFALEALRLLVQERAIQRRDGNWVLGLAISKINIPGKVRDVILRRLKGLGDEERRILDLAAVVGEDFDSETLQELLGIDRLKLLHSLSTIQKTHSLIRSFEAGYKFTHSKIRDVVYEEMIPELRKELHLMIAERIERRFSMRLEDVAGTLADHFHNAQQWEKASAYFALAGDIAMKTHAHEEAYEYYKIALEASKSVSGSLPAEIMFSLLEKKALAAMVSAKIDEALRDLDSLVEAAQRTSDKALVAKAKLLRGWASFWNKDLEGSLQSSFEALKIARDLNDKTLEARCLCLTGITLLAKGSSSEAKENLNESLRISKEVGDKVTETQATLVLLAQGTPR